MEGLVNEGNEAVVNHLKEEDIDLRKHPIEFITYPFLGGTGQVFCNGKAETSVKGLYAAGEEFTHGIFAAATFGWLWGENVALHAKEVPALNIDKVRDSIEEKKNLMNAIQNRRKGYDWKDANIALQ